LEHTSYRFRRQQKATFPSQTMKSPSHTALCVSHQADTHVSREDWRIVYGVVSSFALCKMYLRLSKIKSATEPRISRSWMCTRIMKVLGWLLQCAKIRQCQRPVNTCRPMYLGRLDGLCTELSVRLPFAKCIAGFRKSNRRPNQEVECAHGSWRCSGGFYNVQ
jgi:hypothetical protein